MAQRTQITIVYSIRVSQSSGATRLRCGGIFSDSFIADFPQNVSVKELWKSVENWQQSYWISLVYQFFEHGVQLTNSSENDLHDLCYC